MHQILLESKYLECNLEELVDDNLFIGWVLKGENHEEWEKLIEHNPEFRKKANDARKIILLFDEPYEKLDESSVLDMWKNISDYSHMHMQKSKRLKIQRTISWAASVLLFLSIGTLGYYYFNEKSNNYQFSSALFQDNNDNARLILSIGKEISIDEDNLKISLNDENELIVNNDSVIDLSPKESQSDNKVQMNEVIIPSGKKAELTLPDGTKVWLSSCSRLAFPTKFTKGTRKVFLQGEACFKVTHNENYPFIVNVGHLNIKDLGTYFNVSAYNSDDKIETILLEGSVAISNPNAFGFVKDEIVLKPYQKASFDKKGDVIKVEYEPDADVYFAWTKGWLQFSGESLISVISKLERYYNVEITTPDNFPSNELITGKLSLKDSLNDVLIALDDVAKIKHRINGNEIFIEKETGVLRE